ncbi:MAG: DUF1292 domain-containing protein [Bacilli bacterium]|nr:DUF1292 domain-containing protein [Bacilli bacterium]
MSELKPLDQQLTIIDEEGNEILCQILFTFESEEFKKNYVLFYPLEGDDEDEDNVTVMAASYEEGEDGIGELKEIETDEEWDLIEDVLGQYEEQFADDECECEVCEGDDEECCCGCGCHHEEK